MQFFDADDSNYLLRSAEPASYRAKRHRIIIEQWGILEAFPGSEAGVPRKRRHKTSGSSHSLFANSWKEWRGRRDSNPRPLPWQFSRDRFYNHLQERGDCQNTR